MKMLLLLVVLMPVVAFAQNKQDHVHLVDDFVDYYNKQWYLLIGEENEFGDESFLKHVHADDQQRCRESWHEVIRTGEPYENEFRFKVIGVFPDNVGTHFYAHYGI